MENPLERNVKGGRGQLNSTGEEMDRILDESNHMPRDETSLFMCPPIQNSAHKVEKSDEECGASQGHEAIQIVKQQISQILVSKYVKQDEIISNGADIRAGETNSIQSVKQQISNILIEKYADRQKSISPERNTTGTDKSEKSVPEIEIHTDSNAFENRNSETIMKTTDSLSSSSNLIEGFSIPDFEAEVGEQIVEMNKSTSDNEIAAYSDCVKLTNFENKPSVTELDSANETNTIEVTERAAVPSDFNDGNVIFQALDEDQFDESISPPDFISETETVHEQDVKPEVSEVDDGEVEAQRTLSGPATKVTLDLNTISKLSNIWDKSYRSEKWPKKTKTNSNKNQTTRLNEQLNERGSDVDETFEIVENTLMVPESESEEPAEAKGIHKLQISDSLKLKLLNLSSGQSLNIEGDANEEIPSKQIITPEIEPSDEVDVTSYSETDAVEPEGIESLRISESLKLKLLNIKNMKKLSKSTTKPLKQKKMSLNKTVKPKSKGSNLTTLKRKVGRPRKNPLPPNTTNEIPETTLISQGCQDQYPSNMESKHTVKQVAKSDTCTFKRKVGRPKLQNVKHLSKLQTISNFRLKYKPKFKHTHLKSKSKLVSGSGKNQPKYISADKKTSHSNKTSNQTGLKRKVGRPPKSAAQAKIKEIDKDNEHEQSYKHNFNLKPCFVKLITFESSLNAIQENGIKVNTTMPKRTEIKKGLKIIKKKLGRPKKSVHLEEECKNPNNQNLTEVDDDIQALVESREDFITNKTTEAFTKPKSGKPKKVIAGKAKASVKVSLKPKVHVRHRIMSKQRGPIKIKNRKNSKQVDKDAAQVNEHDNDLLAKEDNINDVAKNDISVKDNTETIQNADETIPGNEDKGEHIGDWEDDWQSDGIDQGDSSDDYFPSDLSDEEYKPKKKSSPKKGSSLQKFKKPPLIKVKSEHMNDTNDDDKIERSENNTVEVANQKSKKGVKSRPYKRKGPRIGRPPVLGEFPCKYCDFVTYEKNLVDKHYSEVHRREWMKCEYCDYSTRSKIRLLEHEGKNHTDSKPFKCGHEGCLYASNVHTDYQKHISQAHTLDKPYQCTQCDYKTRWRRNLSNHAKLRHSDIRKFTCNICNRAFKRKTDLKHHMIWHSDDKPLQCDICGFRCKTNWEIKSHRLSHTNIRNYPCTFPGCTQACKTKSDLTKHMVRHKTVKDFKCELCPNSYKCRASLRKHIQYQHTENRNFPCETCGKAFKVKSALKKHEIIHSDARPFYCEICGSGHTTKNNMETHKLTHRLNELPYHCPICPFGTKLPNALLAHIGANHGDSYAYYCEICRKPFRRYAQLRKHYGRMHSEQDFKNLGHPFEIDLALMKMQMELDLDDTFESVGVSSKKTSIKQEPFDTEFHNLEEDMSSDSDLPDDEEFEAMERELNDETELPHEFRKLKEAQTKKSEAVNKVKTQKKRGRPKKIIQDKIGGLEENVTTEKTMPEPDNVANSAAVNSVSAEQEIIMEDRTVIVENADKQIPGEIAKLDAADKEGSNIASIIIQTVAETKNNEDAAELIANGIQTLGPANEMFTTGPDTNINEQNSKKSSKPDTAENENAHGHCKTISDVNSQEKVDNSNLFNTVLDSDQSVSKSNLPSDNSSKERDHEITSLLSHYCKLTDQREKTNINSKPNDTDDSQLEKPDSNRQPDNEQNSSTVPESTNVSDAFFFNKTENRFQATIALYDGFRLPLATKGFAFNYDKMGTKPKSWFMDPTNMIDHRAREKQMNFMRLRQVRAKLERRARPVYKNGKKPGRAVGYKMSRNYNYKNAKMVKFIQEKRKQGLEWNRITKQWVKKGEENNVTSDELKQIQATEVLKKRRRSFKGNYAEFENLDGDNLTMNDVQELLPVVSKEESKIPKKKQKIVDTNKEKTGVKEIENKKAKSVTKKLKKNSGKRKEAADKTKHVLLYSERKKPTKAMRIRKPGFLGETNENDAQDNVQNGSDMTDLLNVPVPSPQKRKPTRKTKDPAEKKSIQKTKARMEPVQPKYKYVKRAKQKKLFEEKGHTEENGNTNSSSVQGTKRKQTTDKPAVKKAKTTAGKKMQVKFTRNPKQTRVDPNNQLSVTSHGMLHEAVADSNLIRVHLPRNINVSANERLAIPGLGNGPLNVDMRQVVQGGKCLMYCDDVVVMKDLSSSQEIFGLGVNQIKTETFIEPVEPFSENQVFHTGAIVNPVHPILLTQNPVGPIQHSIPLPTGITGPHTINDMGDTVTDDQIAMLGGGVMERTDTSENNEVTGNADKNTREVTQQTGTLLIREASTDKEVMQLDYSIVKNEPND